jgi:hypothetical protein
MSDSTVLISIGSGQTGASSGHDLVTQIARVIGGEGENAIRAQALDCLNRVRIELNQHDWRFMKTTDDPITLVLGTSTYSLDSTFRKPSHALLIDASAIPQYDLRYQDEEWFSHELPRQDITGLPMYYFLRNDFSDGIVSIYPIPDSATAANFRLVVEYYARIGGFADTTDTVDIPEEAINVLVIGGQAYLLRERQKGTPASAVAFQDYQRVKMLLLTDDRRVGDEKARFTLGPRRLYPVGTMFIKV